jgi:hypothetical protein
VRIAARTSPEPGVRLVANDPIHLSPTRILRVLIAVMAFLLLMNLALQYGVYSRGLDLHGPLSQFDVGRERNLPAAFSILLLLSCCIMLATIAAKTRQARDADSSRWAILTLGFAAMAYDEAFSMHERFIEPVRSLLGRDNPGDLGLLYYAWIIPGSALVVVIGLFFFGFLRRLPAFTWSRFVLAGALYLGGVLVMEAIGGKVDSLYGHENMVYAVICTTEEGLEMAGLLVFLAALMRTVNDRFGEIRFRFDADAR